MARDDPRPPGGPPDTAGQQPVRPTRSRAGRLLRDISQQLTDATQILSDEPSTEAVSTAVARLEAAREALALLALERASRGRDRPARVAESPVLLRRVQLPLEPSSSGAARAFCRDACTAWSVPDPVASSAVDVASELVTNAVAHARSVVVLAVELRTDGLLVSAWDDGPGRPRVLPYRPGVSERGIGMRLVKQLSEQWGWTEEQDGKWVWARLALPDEVQLPGRSRRSSSARRRPAEPS